MTVTCTSTNPRINGCLYAMEKSEALDGALGKIPHSGGFCMVSKISDNTPQTIEMKLECNLIVCLSFALDSGSMAYEPWRAGALSYWNDSTMKATISCA